MDSIRDLVDNGHLDEAVDHVLKYLKEQHHRRTNTVRAIKSRLAGYNNDALSGGFDPKDLKITRNRISNDFNSVIDILERDGFECPPAEMPAAPKSRRPSTPSPGNSKTRILFLQANPQDTARLRVQAELREIKAGLRGASNRDNVELESEEAVTSTTLRRALLDHEPNIIHFSGHGEDEGIFLETKSGSSRLVSRNYLANLFELFKENVHCVILNACWSEAQAEAIAEHIPYVIGMRTAVPDDTAIQFSIGFYDAIGDGKDIEFAFKLGKISIDGEGLEGDQIPQLIKQSDRASEDW